MSTQSRLVWLLVRALVLVLPASAQAALPPGVPDQGPLPSLAPMLERTTPAVVNIATLTTYQVRNPLLDDPFFRRFFNVPDSRRYRRAMSAGSGVVVDAEKGFVITNHHVVQKADEISVTLSDGRTLVAELVGADPHVDLAVLKVPPEHLTEIAFADSSELRVGDFVVAIGNPFGLSQTVTSGIVSALGRSGLGIEGYEDFIQTDASINPGNSGGALVDLLGRLVGLNTAILAPAGGNVGIGFAIPANMVRAIMDEIIRHGEVRRGYLGLSVQGLNVELAEAFGVDKQEGVVVVEVDPAGPAGAAGLEAGDIILRVGDRPIRTVAQFHGQTAIIFAGQNVDFDLLRNGREKHVRLSIGEENLDKQPGERVDRRLRGSELQKCREDDSAGEGILVTRVDSDSEAWTFGLRPGDVIVGANRQDVRNLSELRDASRIGADQLLLRVYRSGQFGYVSIR